MKTLRDIPMLSGERFDGHASHFRKARVSLPLESREHPLEALRKEQ